MKTKEEIFEALAAHRTELERFGVKSVAVFGSAARGEELGPQSDIDRLVEFNRPVGLFAFLDLKQYLESLLKRRVDLTTPEALKPQLRDRILSEAVRAA
jgi:predicted nucleotidyltransferase